MHVHTNIWEEMTSALFRVFLGGLRLGVIFVTFSFHNENRFLLKSGKEKKNNSTGSFETKEVSALSGRILGIKGAQSDTVSAPVFSKLLFLAYFYTLYIGLNILATFKFKVA